MNAWEHEAVRSAIIGTGRKALLFAGLLTEACVGFPAICAAAEGYSLFVVADACGGLTAQSHEIALRRMQSAGVDSTSRLQWLQELQRDWTRHETYDSARAIVEDSAAVTGSVSPMPATWSKPERDL